MYFLVLHFGIELFENSDWKMNLLYKYIDISCFSREKKKIINIKYHSFYVQKYTPFFQYFVLSPTYFCFHAMLNNLDAGNKMFRNVFITIVRTTEFISTTNRELDFEDVWYSECYVRQNFYTFRGLRITLKYFATCKRYE